MNFRKYFERGKRDRDLAAEIESYVEHETAANMARGMSQEEAKQAAQRKFGNAGMVRENVYGQNGIGWLDALAKDIRHGLRQLRLNPAFTLTAVATLALGIGANTAIFQILDAVRLRMLPVANPHELYEVQIAGGNLGMGIGPRRNISATMPQWAELQRRQSSFDNIFALSEDQIGAGPEQPARRYRVLWVSGDTFPALGMQPAAGRLFDAADDKPKCGLQAAVISHSLWMSDYGGEPNLSNKTVLLAGRRPAVMGVTPRTFYGLETGRDFDVALPLCAREALGFPMQRKDIWSLNVFGRIKAPRTLAAAREDLGRISPGIFELVAPTDYDKQVTDTWKRFIMTAQPAGQGLSRLREQYERPLWLLLGISGLVLSIACANLANLQLARTTAREREFAVRLAVGGSRARLLQYTAVESLLLAVAGTAAGTALAYGLSRTMVEFLSQAGTPIRLDMPFDWRFAAFAAFVTLVTSALFGAVPALRASATDPAEALRSGGRGQTASRERMLFQRAIVSGQLAVAIMLAAGAFLFVRSLNNLMTFDTGFRRDGLVFTFVDYSSIPDARPRMDALNLEIVSRIQAIPGVASVASTTRMPMSGGSWEMGVQLPGTTDAQRVFPKFTWVGPGYFQTMGIGLLTGREFSPADTRQSRKVALVNEQFVKRFMSGKPPIGTVIRSVVEPGYPEALYEIVGLVRDHNYATFREDVPPIVYGPFSQYPNPFPAMDIAIRTGQNAGTIERAVQSAVSGVGSSIRVTARDFRNEWNRHTVQERLMAWLAGFFGGLAALLAMVGLYGVIAYMAARRRGEIGIRLALGATRGSIVRLVLRETGMALVAGIPLGLFASVVFSKAASALLFGLAPDDAVSLGGAAAALGVLALAASSLPAWRAARANALAALRIE